MPESPLDMIDRLTAIVPGVDCHVWLGSHSRDYAKMRWTENNKRQNARVIRMLCEAGDLEVDHLCHNRWCVNPSHLEAVTHRENIRRQRIFAVSNRQFCKKHPTEKLRLNGKVRICRICKTEYQRRYRNGAES
jgi:hypothetical protein